MIKKTSIYINELRVSVNNETIIKIDKLITNSKINCMISNKTESSEMLINCICGMQENEGEIIINNIDTYGLNIYQRNIRLIAQDPFIISGCSVKYNIMFGVREDDINKDINNRYKYLIQLFEIENLENKNIETVDRFEQVLSNIIMSLITQPNMIIIDTTIDNYNNKKIIWLISKIKQIVNKEDTVFLIHTSNMSIVQQIDNTIVLQDGELAQCDNFKNIIEYPTSYNAIHKTDIFIKVHAEIKNIDQEYIVCEIHNNLPKIYILKKSINKIVCNNQNVKKITIIAHKDSSTITEYNNNIYSNQIPIQIINCCSIFEINYVQCNINNNYYHFKTIEEIIKDKKYAINIQQIPIVIMQ